MPRAAKIVSSSRALWPRESCAEVIFMADPPGQAFRRRREPCVPRMMLCAFRRRAWPRAPAGPGSARLGAGSALRGAPCRAHRVMRCGGSFDPPEDTVDELSLGVGGEMGVALHHRELAVPHDVGDLEE